MNNNLIITIGREYGTGGREIGQKLALRLGIPFYDRELITRAAKRQDSMKSCSSSSTSVPPTASFTR